MSLAIKQFELLDALKFVSHASAVRDIRYYLNGVYFEYRNGILHLVATDGHRMAVAVLEPSPGDGPDFEFILPGDAVKALLATPKNLNGTMSLALNRFNDKLESVSFESANGATQILMPIEGKFPDWRRVDPTINTSRNSPIYSTSFNGTYVAQANAALAKLGDKYQVVTLHLTGERDAMCFVGSLGASYRELTKARVIVMPTRQ